MNNKEIANQLITIASGYPPMPEVRFKHKALNILIIDGLTIKCLPFKECILTVAKKYEKARKYSTKGVSCKQPTKKRSKFSWRVVKEFMSEQFGLDNAINYMQLHDQTVYFLKRIDGEHRLIVDIVKSEGDFIQTKQGVVTHTPSGLTCGDKYKTIDSLCDLIRKAVSELPKEDLKFQQDMRIQHGCA